MTGVGCQRPPGPGGLRARLGAGLAGAPGFLGTGPPPLARSVASSSPPASAWPGLRALSLHLSQRVRRLGGASQEGSALRGHPPRRGLAASASGFPRAPPGPAWRAGPGPALATERARCGGGEPPGTERRPTGGHGVGGWRALGGLRDAVGILVPALCPPTRSRRRVTFVRRPNMVGAERQPPLPLRPAGLALWASDAGRGQSRCPASPRCSASGAGSPERPGKPSRELRAPASRSLSAEPRVSDRLPPSPFRSREGKEAGSLLREPGLCSGTR